MTPKFLAAALAVSVSACSLSDEPVRTRAADQGPLEAAFSQPAAWTSLPSGASAVIMLPSAAGEVAQVRERSFSNGFGQAVQLQGEGSAKDVNRVEITVATLKGEGAGHNRAPMAKPSEAGIKAEIAARFPGVAMQVVKRPMSNAYGPYGLAIGRRLGGARCIYAWQWIDDVRGTAGSRPRWMTLGRAIPASVRVHLCRSDLTIDQLAAYVDQMTIDLDRRSGGSEALEAAPDAVISSDREGLERSERLRLPDGLEGRESLSASAPPRARKNARRRAPERATERAQHRIADTAPASSWSPDGRQYLAPVQAARAAPATDWARIGRMPPDARQPSRGSEGAAYGGAPSTAAVPSPNGRLGAAPNKGKALDPSLPIQAYLGPASHARVKTTASAPETTASTARTEQP